MPTKTTRPARVHVWAPVAFAHLRAYRCGVFLDETEPGNDALCAEPALYVAEFTALTPSGRGPLTALCADHAEAARTWPTVVGVVAVPAVEQRSATWRPLATSGPGDCRVGDHPAACACGEGLSHAVRV